MSERIDNFHRWIIITQFLGETHRLSLSVLLGPPESGKTALVQSWLRSVQGQEQFSHITYLTVQTQETPLRFAQRLLQEMGHKPFSRNTSHSMNELGEQFRATSVPLLILDQAERCSLDLLLCLRFYLFSKSGISLLLVGRMELDKTLARDEKIENRIGSCQTIEQFDEGTRGKT